MQAIWIIYVKELIDSLRDKKTFFMSFLLPVLMIPALLLAVVNVQKSKSKQDSAKVLKVAVIHHGNANAFLDRLKETEDLELVDAPKIDAIVGSIRNEEIDAIYLFSKDLDSALANIKKGYVNLYYLGQRSSVLERRLMEPLRAFKEEVDATRYADLGIKREQLQALDIRKRNLKEVRVLLAETIGGMLPYFFTLMVCMGCLVPALDLGAGEKERGTLETLLVLPVARMHFLIGKFLLVATFGFFAGFLNIVSLYFSLRFLGGEIPGEIMTALSAAIEWQNSLLVLSLLIPLSLFFSGVGLMLSFFARNFKEAQSYIQPLIYLAILPPLLSMILETKLTSTTALIPIANVSLATKAILGGTYSVIDLILTFGSMSLCALLVLYLASLLILKEKVLFRS
jgi:sodium transport system permease protein